MGRQIGRKTGLGLNIDTSMYISNGLRIEARSIRKSETRHVNLKPTEHSDNDIL